MNAAMIAHMVSKEVMRIDMGTGNMPSKGGSARRLPYHSFYPIPDCIQLRQICLAKLLTALF
jgi:hypothetical protein